MPNDPFAGPAAVLALRRSNLERARELLHVVSEPAQPQPPDEPTAIVQPIFVCRDCGAAMLVVETLLTRGCSRQARAA